MNIGIKTVLEQIKRLDGNPLEIDSADNPLYKQTKMAVDSLKKKNNLENIYILSNEGGKERILVLSDTSDDFGTDYSFSPEMKEALTTNKETVSDVYEDPHTRRLPSLCLSLRLLSFQEKNCNPCRNHRTYPTARESAPSRPHWKGYRYFQDCFSFSGCPQPFLSACKADCPQNRFQADSRPDV